VTVVQICAGVMTVEHPLRSRREAENAIDALKRAQEHLAKSAEFLLVEAKDREEQLAMKQSLAEAELDARRTDLDAEAAVLARQREVGEEFAERQMRRIKLNVGGKLFETSKPTLLAEPDSMLYALVHSGAFLPDEKTGEYFIDRDPKFFGTFLNYLRDNRGDGQLNLDLEDLRPTDCKQLYSDIQYYQFSSLMHLLPSEGPVEIPNRLNFVGFAQWSQDGAVQSHRVQDRLMSAAAQANFPDSRPATLEEYMAGTIRDLPSKNISGDPITFYGESTDGMTDDHAGKFGVSLGEELDGTRPTCMLYRHRRSIICVLEESRKPFAIECPP